MVVVWFFLRSARATLISALAIPLSAIPTFAFMEWIGFTLNQMTLLALSLVTTLCAAVLFQPILMGKPRVPPPDPTQPA